MKKRLLSALLALALVFVLLPTTALAGETTGSDYDISINGTGWKFETDDSGACIPVYYYANYTFNTDAGYGFRTNDNLMLTKEGNTVTITIRRGTSHDHGNYSPITFTLKKESTKKNDVPCIEMGNDNNLVITGKGTLNITRDEKNGIGAALCSEVGDITITDGITVKANFLKQVSESTTGNAISIKDHNLIISGKNTKVEARNSSCNFQDLYDVSAAVCVENGEIKVSDGATLSAINNFTNSYTSQYSYYSRAISGSSSKPCALTVTGENSCVIAETDNSLGKAYGHVNFSIDGAKIEVGTSSPAQTITDINDISNYKYAKISVPALEKDSYVSIAGDPAVVGVETSIPSANGSGTYFYDQASKTLTLNNVTINKTSNNAAKAIQFDKNNGTYTVNLVGTNTISNVSYGISTNSAYSEATSMSVTITGSGSLDISAKAYAIEVPKGDLTFNGAGEIKLTTSNISPTHNVLSVKGNITITDMSKYSVTGTQQTGGKPLGSEVSLTEASQLKGGTTGYRIITITPTPAKDSTISYDGKTLKQGETIRNGGTATVDSKNNTITLNNFKGDKALVFNAEFTPNSITLIGDSTLSAVETKYQDLTISGSGSLTVGSIRVPNNTQHTANLTINGGAHVTVNRPSSEDEPAVEVSGNLTVTGEGTQLSAECTAATNPAIEVGGNVTISGNPGTNAYTVKAYNKYATQRGRDDKLRPSQMPSAIEISGDSLSISNSARVMAKTDSDGAAVWMSARKVISVVDAYLIAQNSSHNFSTISFGDGSDMGNIYAKGQVNIVAENMLHSSSSLAHRAIKAFIYNHYSTGDSNPYYINVVSEGVQSGGKVNVIPGHCTSTGGYKVTITRGDAYSAPTTISRIIITGLTPPVKGETPVTTGVSLGTGLTVTEVTWGGTFTSDGEFKADESYTAHIKYTVDAGYMLATDAQCQDISAADTVRLNKSESQVEVTFHTGGGSTHQHVEGPWEADTQGGHHIKKCTECGEVMVSEEHIYRYAYESPTTHKVNCGVCGVNFVRAHSYTDSYVPTVDGTQHHGKCICGAEETTLRDHVFVNGVCVCGVTQSGGDPTPDVPAAPTGLVGVAPTSENGNGKITGTTAQMEYATSLEGDWTACANDSTDVPAGKYYVRMKKTDNTPAGEAVEVTVPAYSGTGEIVPPTPDNPGTIVIIRPAEEEKPAQQPNPSTGANDLVGLAVAAAVAAALGSAALLRKHD